VLIRQLRSDSEGDRYVTIEVPDEDAPPPRGEVAAGGEPIYFNGRAYEFAQGGPSDYAWNPALAPFTAGLVHVPESYGDPYIAGRWLWPAGATAGSARVVTAQNSGGFFGNLDSFLSKGGGIALIAAGAASVAAGAAAATTEGAAVTSGGAGVSDFLDPWDLLPDPSITYAAPDVIAPPPPAPGVEVFRDPWDLLPDPSITYTPPEVVNLPLPAQGTPGRFDLSQSSSLVRTIGQALGLGARDTAPRTTLGTGPSNFYLGNVGGRPTTAGAQGFRGYYDPRFFQTGGAAAAPSDPGRLILYALLAVGALVLLKG